MLDKDFSVCFKTSGIAVTTEDYSGCSTGWLHISLARSGNVAFEYLPRTFVELWPHNRHCFARVIFPVLLLLNYHKSTTL